MARRIRDEERGGKAKLEVMGKWREGGEEELNIKENSRQKATGADYD